MSLPENKRLEVGTTKFMKGWIYGAPFSGKTTFLDNAPDPLNLNTDGNTKYVTMQRIYIRDEVTITGRITNRKFAWEVFKDAITDLEKGSEFQTIIVDLVEDTREMCRLYMYDKLSIQHESDSGFGKGWDIIKTEYLSTMRRLLNLDYNIFLVSHEDISKDLTMRSGDKISRIAPNIQEAVAVKLAGMVDFVARVIVKDDETRVLSFKHNEVTFGGGRLGIIETEIPLDWEELVKVYDEAIKNAASKKLEVATNVPKNVETPEQPVRRSRKKTEESSSNEEKPEETSTEEPEIAVAPAPEEKTEEKTEEPKKRTRKKREAEAAPVETAPVEEAPKRKRKRRTTK